MARNSQATAYLKHGSSNKYSATASLLARGYSTEASTQKDVAEDAIGYKGNSMLSPFTSGSQATNVHPLVIEKSEVTSVGINTEWGLLMASISKDTGEETPLQEFISFVRSYLVPEGFPDSVTESYVPYMTRRALEHFFGGAMGVLTTQTLLSSVGISRNKSAPGAVAINWILKLKPKSATTMKQEKVKFQMRRVRGYGQLILPDVRGG